MKARCAEGLWLGLGGWAHGLGWERAAWLDLDIYWVRVLEAPGLDTGRGLGEYGLRSFIIFFYKVMQVNKSFFSSN